MYLINKMSINVSETMEAGDFKDFAKAMTDYIAEYLENIRDRSVFMKL